MWAHDVKILIGCCTYLHYNIVPDLGCSSEYPHNQIEKH